MKIKDYLVHDAQHFIPIENLPVIAPATRLDDALWLMGSRHANVAIIQNSPFELGLLPRNPAPAFGGAEVVGAGLVSGTPIQVVDDEEDSARRSTPSSRAASTPTSSVWWACGGWTVSSD